MTSSIAKRLIRARADLGWSQADLARASGVAATQISRYEAGSTPRPQVVAKLAKAINEPFEWLLTGEEPDLGDGVIELRMPAEMVAKLDHEAREQNLSFEQYVLKLLECGFEQAAERKEV